jgi:hypothetical protein
MEAEVPSGHEVGISRINRLRAGSIEKRRKRMNGDLSHNAPQCSHDNSNRRRCYSSPSTATGAGVGIGAHPTVNPMVVRKQRLQQLEEDRLRTEVGSPSPRVKGSLRHIIEKFESPTAQRRSSLADAEYTVGDKFWVNFAAHKPVRRQSDSSLVPVNMSSGLKKAAKKQTPTRPDTTSQSEGYIGVDRSTNKPQYTVEYMPELRKKVEGAKKDVHGMSRPHASLTTNLTTRQKLYYDASAILWIAGLLPIAICILIVRSTMPFVRSALCSAIDWSISIACLPVRQVNKLVQGSVPYVAV